MQGFLAVPSCRDPSRRVDLDPRDAGDRSRHWELVGPRGSQKIRSVLRNATPGCAAYLAVSSNCANTGVTLGSATAASVFTVECSNVNKNCVAYAKARADCPCRPLGFSTTCSSSFAGMYRLGDPAAITRIDALLPQAAPPAPLKRPPPPKPILQRPPPTQVSAPPPPPRPQWRRLGAGGAASGAPSAREVFDGDLHMALSPDGAPHVAYLDGTGTILTLRLWIPEYPAWVVLAQKNLGAHFKFPFVYFRSGVPHVCLMYPDVAANSGVGQPTIWALDGSNLDGFYFQQLMGADDWALPPVDTDTHSGVAQAPNGELRLANILTSSASDPVLAFAPNGRGYLAYRYGLGNGCIRVHAYDPGSDSWTDNLGDLCSQAGPANSAAERRNRVGDGARAGQRAGILDRAGPAQLPASQDGGQPDLQFTLAPRPLLLAFNGSGALFLANEAQELTNSGAFITYGTDLYVYSGGQWKPTAPSFPQPNAYVNWPFSAISLAGGPPRPCALHLWTSAPPASSSASGGRPEAAGADPHA
ncbi:hypothetical protein ABPG75_006416 [Micractinium tetrahymenae]